MKVLFYPDKVVSFARIRVIFKMMGWEIGAEYCEIDILRDKELYIMDVNNTSGMGGFEKNYIEIYDKTNQQISKALNKYEKCK